MIALLPVCSDAGYENRIFPITVIVIVLVFVKGGLVVPGSDNMTSDAGYDNRIFPITLIVIVLVLVLAGGFGYWYYASQKLNPIAKDAPRQIPSNFKTSPPEFEAVYAQLGIQPLP